MSSKYNSGIIAGGNIRAGGTIHGNVYGAVVMGGSVFSMSGRDVVVQLDDDSYSDVLEVIIEVKTRNGTVKLKREQIPNVVVNGNVNRVNMSVGNITVNGNVEKVDNVSGNVSITGDVEKASSVSGDIIAEKIVSGKSVSGDVRIK